MSVPSTPAPLGIWSLLGLRTLSSHRFRIVLAMAILAAAATVLGAVLLARSASPVGQFGIDATDYLTAASRIARGASPYASDMLVGPVDSQGVDRYRYPPPLAQVLSLMVTVPTQAALWAWFALGLAAIVAALLVALRTAAIDGAEPRIWVLAAATLFLPVFDCLWKGNVSTMLALLVALAVAGGATSGVAIVLATLLKVVPVVLAPAWFVVGGPSRRAMVVTALAVVSVSVLASPGAWLEYLVVLPNMLAGTAHEATNVAPWSMVATSGAPEWLGQMVRIGSVGISVLAVGGSIVVVRRPGGLALAGVLCSIAMLLLPAALWYHYLVVLLPLAIVAWPRASGAARAMLVLAGAGVSAGVAWLPLATFGWVAMAAILAWVLARGVVPDAGAAERSAAERSAAYAARLAAR